MERLIFRKVGACRPPLLFGSHRLSIVGAGCYFHFFAALHRGLLQTGLVVVSHSSTIGAHHCPAIRLRNSRGSNPSDGERVNLTNLDLVAQWAGIDGARDDATTVRGSLFALMGINGAEPPRMVAVLPSDDVQTTINWRILQTGGAAAIAPTLAQLGQVGVFLRTCRFLCGPLPEQIQAAIPPAAAPVMGPTPRKVKMNQVINQLDDEEVENLDAPSMLPTEPTCSGLVGSRQMTRSYPMTSSPHWLPCTRAAVRLMWICPPGARSSIASSGKSS